MVTRNFLLLFFVLLGVGCTPQCEKSSFEPAKPIANPVPEFKMKELARGEGPKLNEGDILELHYQSWIFDHSQPDQKGELVGDTYASGTPLKINFGKDELIEGWIEGLRGIRAKGKRRLFIPSTMAYGDEGAGTKIPKGAHLVYDIEVVSLTSVAAPSPVASPEGPGVPELTESPTK
jgi:FKBP-type peptidyl-prolyl cis-trans isomerase